MSVMDLDPAGFPCGRDDVVAWEVGEVSCRCAYAGPYDIYVEVAARGQWFAAGWCTSSAEATRFIVDMIRAFEGDAGSSC